MSESKFKYVGELARTVAAILGVATMIGAPMWKFWLSPMLVASVSTAMAQSMEQKIERAVADRVNPINIGLKAIIEGNIAKLRERIDLLEFKRDFMPETWTEMDRQELFNLNGELETQQTALNSIRASERQ